MSGGRQKLNTMSSLRAICPVEPRKKLTKREAAKRLAQLAEKRMERDGLSDAKKNARVQSFVEYVDAVSANRAK
jgi:hypothetical protein